MAQRKETRRRSEPAGVDNALSQSDTSSGGVSRREFWLSVIGIATVLTSIAVIVLSMILVPAFEAFTKQ